MKVLEMKRRRTRNQGGYSKRKRFVEIVSKKIFDVDFLVIAERHESLRLFRSFVRSCSMARAIGPIEVFRVSQLNVMVGTITLAEESR